MGRWIRASPFETLGGGGGGGQGGKPTNQQSVEGTEVHVFLKAVGGGNLGSGTRPPLPEEAWKEP